MFIIFNQIIAYQPKNISNHMAKKHLFICNSQLAIPRTVQRLRSVGVEKNYTIFDGL